MHGLSTMHCNLVTDIRLAAECGFEALEIIDMKLVRYLKNGYDAKDLNHVFQRNGIRPVCINALKNIERIGKEEKRELLAEAEILIKAACSINCPTIQLVPFCGLAGMAREEILKLTAANIAEIADMGKEYGDLQRIL